MAASRSRGDGGEQGATKDKQGQGTRRQQRADVALQPPSTGRFAAPVRTTSARVCNLLSSSQEWLMAASMVAPARRWKRRWNHGLLREGSLSSQIFFSVYACKVFDENSTRLWGKIHLCKCNYVPRPRAPGGGACNSWPEYFDVSRYISPI